MVRVRPLLLCILSLSVLSGCVPTPVEDGKLHVTATFYPLADIVKGVGGEFVTVTTIIPPGVEPHDYEPSPQDIVRFSKSDAFVTMGLEFTPIEQKVVTSGFKGTVISASAGVALLSASEDEFGQPEAHEEGTGADPHIWLSPRNMIVMTERVREGLIAADPAHADAYKANAEQYETMLFSLDKDFTTGLSTCKQRTILTSHRAFSYLAKDYGITQLSIGGLSPESEPTPGQLTQLVEAARSARVKYIFYEELVDPRIAQTIATEVGAQPLELSPVEGSRDPADDYNSIMRRNLLNLRVALECS